MQHVKRFLVPITLIAVLGIGLITAAFSPAPAPPSNIVVKNNTNCAMSVRIIWGTVPGNPPCCAAPNTLVCISIPANTPTVITIPPGKSLCQLAVYCPPNCATASGAVWNCPNSGLSTGTCGACNFSMNYVSGTFDINPI